MGRGPRRGPTPPLPSPLLHPMEERACLVAASPRWAVSQSCTLPRVGRSRRVESIRRPAEYNSGTCFSVAQPSRPRVAAASRRQHEHRARRPVNSQARTPALQPSVRSTLNTNSALRLVDPLPFPSGNLFLQPLQPTASPCPVRVREKTQMGGDTPRRTPPYLPCAFPVILTSDATQ